MLSPENVRERLVVEFGNLLLMNIELASRVGELESALKEAKLPPPPPPSDTSEEVRSPAPWVPPEDV